MTARTTFNGSVQIKASGTNPKEVLASYIAELKTSNHNITVSRGTRPSVGTCRGCGVEFRVYWPIIGNEDLNIFSDFTDGVQCPRKHMNVFGGEV